MRAFWVAVVLCVVGSAGAVSATERLVRDPSQYRAALSAARPGDSIVLADGVWRDFEIVFEGQGTAKAPITLRAQNPGRVSLEGRSSLKLAGRYLKVAGLVFRNGYSPSGEVIAFRRDSKTLANDSRVTETVIDGFNNPDRGQVDYWVALYGKNNRFDHNHVEGKLNSGVTLAVILSTPESLQNHHRIDHNYFGPRPPLGSNGGETIRIGVSQHSLSDSNTLVENNYFERTSGEAEIISNKSGGNIYRGNVFVRAQGALTLRHGNGNLVEGNLFLGGGEPHTGGVRVINADQTVRGNLFAGLAGEGFTGALVVMNGVPNSPLNRYHQVRNALIENNIFLDVARIEFGVGASTERSAPPISSIMRNNLIMGQGDARTLATGSDISGVTFSGNIVSGVAKPDGLAGFEIRAIERQPGPGGVSLPAASVLKALGLPGLPRVPARDQTGVSWYPKGGSDISFDSGKVTAVSPGTDGIARAVAAAAPGDVLQLAAGDYTESRTIDVPVALTLRTAKSSSGAMARIVFERSTLFNLVGKGDLKLERVRISGEAAPDSVGDTVIRAVPSYPLHNYRVEIIGSEVSDLLVNKGFSVLKAEKGTFAERIRIIDSSFSNLTGPVLSLAGETEAFGLYSAEAVEISGSSFSKIGAPALDVLRGGTDESTFGPRIVVANSVFRDVGAAGGPSMELVGAQDVRLSENRFERAGSARVTIKVGEPRLFETGSVGRKALEIIDNRR